jgi:hypothetical protein
MSRRVRFNLLIKTPKAGCKKLRPKRILVPKQNGTNMELNSIVNAKSKNELKIL